MFTLAQDLRFALRQLRKSPGYAVVAIVTLALGIGANTAIFLLTWSILLRSLPVPNPGELIRYTFRKGESDIGLSYQQYQALQKQQNVATGLFAWQSSEATLTRDGHSQKIPVALTTGSVFPVLQLRPALGRAFEANVGEKGNGWQPVALLSYDYWRTAFHADPAIVGQSIRLDNTSITVIGVLPRGFDGVAPESPIDVLLPLDFEGILHPRHSMLYQPGAFWLTVMGRLRPGQTRRSGAGEPRRDRQAGHRGSRSLAQLPHHRILRRLQARCRIRPRGTLLAALEIRQTSRGARSSLRPDDAAVQRERRAGRDLARQFAAA
jgi:putative ABC transport system permease protein